jgi:hypothetical protein
MQSVFKLASARQHEREAGDTRKLKRKRVLPSAADFLLD